MTVENTLTHGLQTSQLGSAYKTEEDANLAKLDANRITQVVTTVNDLPAAGTGGRFIFVRANGVLYYDNGTTWDTQSNSVKGSMLISRVADYNMTANQTIQDVLFNKVEYAQGSLSSATIDGSGGIVIPSGVDEIKMASRVAMSGFTARTGYGIQVAVFSNHAATPQEAANETKYAFSNAAGTISLMLNSPASIPIVAGDVIDTTIIFLSTPPTTPVLEALTPQSDPKSWMYIEAV